MKIIDSTIIVALISMAGTIIGSMIGVMKSNDKTIIRSLLVTSFFRFLSKL